MPGINNQSGVFTFIQRNLWWILLVLVAVLQIPFLQADPDLYLSHSRDAHSDEGLNTIQLRNYINHGYLNPWECDNLMKNPLFNLVLFLPFKIFGTQLLVGRLTVLFFISSILFIIGLHKAWRKWLVFMVPVVFLQFHIFQYMHFALAETMAIGCILLGMLGIVQMWDESKTAKKLLYVCIGTMGLFFAWLMKIQFVYVSVIGLVLMLIYLVWDLVKNRKLTRQSLLVLAVAVSISTLLGFIYYQYWYLPYREPFIYIMKNQTGGRFHFGIYFWRIVGENLSRYFSTQYVLPVWIACLVALIPGIYVWVKTENKLYKRIFLFSLIWMLVELHKIAIHHVPSRYLLSGYASMLVLVATLLFGLSTLAREKTKTIFKNIYGVGVAGMLLLVTTHVYNYGVALNRRSYQVRDLNNYMYHYNELNLVVIGPWAPTVTWNTKMRALPVWKDFLNDKQIKQKFKPDIVVTEPGESDSDGAFCADNFDIVNESDSVKKTWIGKWPVHIYWMKKEQDNSTKPRQVN